MWAEPTSSNRVICLAAKIAGHLIICTHVITIELRPFNLVDDTGVEPVTYILFLYLHLVEISTWFRQYMIGATDIYENFLCFLTT